VVLDISPLDPKVQEVKAMFAQLSIASQPSTTETCQRLSSTEVTCPLPKKLIGLNSGVPHMLYQVSLSPDGGSYGTSINVSVVDSNCATSVNGNITTKDTVCIIDDVCLSDGSHNGYVSGESCDVKSSTTTWTKGAIKPVQTDLQKLKLASDDGAKLTCAVGASTTSRQVLWFKNGNLVKQQTAPPGQTEVAASLSEFLATGLPAEIECRMDSPNANDQYYSNKFNIA